MMNKPTNTQFVVGWVSDSHLGYTQYGSALRERDFFLGLKQALLLLLEEHKVDTIIHTGDLFNQARLTSQTWHEFMELEGLLRQYNRQMWTITGNHDLAEPQWLPESSGHTAGIHRLDGTVIDRATQLRLTGYRFHPAPELKPMLLTAPPSDLLLLHAPVLEFVGFPLPQALSLADIPSGLAQLVCLGDIHQRRFLPLPSDPRVEAGYPGSTELCSSSEESGKTAELIYFDVQRKLLGHEPVPFDTRPVVRCEVSTEEEFSTRLAELKIWNPADHGNGVISGDARYPLLLFKHSVEIASVRERLLAALDPDKWIVRLDLLGTDTAELELWQPSADQESVRPDVSATLAELLSPTDPAFALAQQLARADLDPSVALESYLQSRIPGV